MKIIKNVVKFLFIFLLILLVFAALWTRKNFGNVTFDEILFHLMVPIEGTNSSVLNSFILKSLFPSIILTFIAIFIISYQTKYSLEISISRKSKTKKFILYPFNKKIRIVIYLSLLIISILFTILKLDIIPFLKYNFSSSTFIEEKYVNPRNINITFPDKKRNLVFIFLESMEASYADKDNGGIIENNLIPNLTKLAYDNISFSNTTKLGGGLSTPGATWTSSAMSTYHSGVPLKLGIYNTTIKDALFLPGAYNLGDLLYDNGYNNELMIGSKVIFGNREQLFRQHGNYKIFDWQYLVDNGLKTEDDHNGWWGLEDYDLFNYAKEELKNLAKEDKPFNLTLLTVDTHFEDGYYSKRCSGQNFGNQYKNVINCNDSMVYDFINWIKKQDFYKDTTIILVGDHLTMDVDFFDEYDSNYTRTIYNVFINSAKKTDNTKNRLFMTYDIFPSILTSMGITYDGDRVGIGTDLFSSSKTLTEEYGYEYVFEELNKKSVFYNNEIAFKKN